MTPELVFFGVRSLARLGTAAKSAYTQKIRDADASIRIPDKITVDPFDFALTLLDEIVPQRLEDGGDLFDCFDDGSPKNDPVCKSRIIRAAEDYWPAGLWKDRSELLVGDGARLERDPAGANGYVVLKQWAKGTEPPGAFARIGITLADIVLDFASTNPRIFGVGSNGEKLIAAVALNLSELLPDPDRPLDWQGQFAERVTVSFFEAGLRALDQNLDAFVDEEHFSSLAKGTITPMIELFEETRIKNPGKLPVLFEIRDTLFGPLAKSAIQTVLKHQVAFLGTDFNPEKAVGAVTRSILEAAADDGLRQLYGKEGLLKIYDSLLGVVAERPELFVRGTGKEFELARDLVGRFSTTLRGAPPPFGDTLAADIVADAVTVLGSHVSLRFDQEKPWEAVAISSINSVVDGFKEGLKDHQGILASVISRAQLREITQIIMIQAAKTPGMIIGEDVNPELRNISAAVMNVLANPDSDLLSQEAWRDVIIAALNEASRNPATLFSLDKNAKPASQLAVQLISDLLATASETLGENRNRRLGVVLFGETLRDATIEVLRESTRNATALTTPEGRKAAANLAERLNKLALNNAGLIGSQEWIWLYRRYIAFVIQNGKIVEWSDEELIDLLHLDEDKEETAIGSQ